MPRREKASAASASPCLRGEAYPYTWAYDECSGCRLKPRKLRACPAHCKGYRPMYRGRKGARCCAVTFGAKGTVLVEFEDGEAVVGPRRALRRAKEEKA